MDAEVLESLRAQVRPLLNLGAPADAVAAYYALYHDPQRSALYVSWIGTRNSRGFVVGGSDEGGFFRDMRDMSAFAAGRPDGFVALCQTGQRLFQPTVILRTPNAHSAANLLRHALAPGRPYYLITTPDLRDAVAEVAAIEQPELNRVFELDLARFEPQINVLVVAERGPNGLPRFVIRSQGEVAAEAGVAWQSPHYAELSVTTRSAAQGRGWGRAVVSACTQWVVQSAKRPLYIAAEGNAASLALAGAVGYVDTGIREYAGDAVCLPDPEADPDLW
jgi:hypothetical protein